MWCGPIETPDTFTSRSIGGYHKVYRLTKQLAKCIQNGQPVNAVLCEIFHNKRSFMYGDGKIDLATMNGRIVALLSHGRLSLYARLSF